MTGIDTDSLIRYLVQDEPVQAKAATHLIEKKCRREDPGFLNHLVLCETTWVLDGCYDQGKESIMRTIEQLLRVAQLRVESSHVVWKALEDYRKGPADFADYLLSRINEAQGCLTTATFDRAAGKTSTFTLLK
ncbi:MAG: PIN domain-containing protein [Nitrospirales bacterium]|nr:MAG: PIN domain-containing protein [Nitrospirales bacterium]